MNRKPSRPPYALIVTAVALVVIGQVFKLVGGMFISKEALENDIFLLAIPFLTIFIAIILTFIFLIVMLARALNYKVSRRVYGIIEAVILAGIALGIIGMFQPWLFAAYRYGFMLLLISTLAFIAWSHVSPQGIHRKETVGPLSVSELEAAAEK